jgi:hypothetical protein
LFCKIPFVPPNRMKYSGRHTFIDIFGDTRKDA